MIAKFFIYNFLRKYVQSLNIGMLKSCRNNVIFCNINVIFRKTEDIYLESLNVSPVAQLIKKLLAIYVFFCNNDPPFDCPPPYTDTMHNKIIFLQSKKVLAF